MLCVSARASAPAILGESASKLMPRITRASSRWITALASASHSGVSLMYAPRGSRTRRAGHQARSVLSPPIRSSGR